MNMFFGLKFLLFSFLLIYINCCFPGYYLSSGKCIPCQSGYYSEGAISTAKSSKCEECPEGTYSGKGSSKCIPCPAGTFSKSKSRKCQNCPKGTFSLKGKSLCTPCPEKYFADIEGSSYCKQCPDNTNSYRGSSSCFECPKGDKSCSHLKPKKSNIKRNNSEKSDDKLEEFGKLMTLDIFGKSIEFFDNQVTFHIPKFTIIATIFNEITFDLVKDIYFLISNHGFTSMEYKNYEIYKNITEIANTIIDALKEEYTISIPILETKIGEHIANGEIYITYNFPLNAIEVTIVSKSTDEIGNEYKVGIKYKIIPDDYYYDDDDPSQELEPAPVIEENYVENLIKQFAQKSYEYVYYIIDFLKKPEVLAAVGSIVAIVLIVALLEAISGGTITPLITAIMTAVTSLLQNGFSVLRFGIN